MISKSVTFEVKIDFFAVLQGGQYRYIMEIFEEKISLSQGTGQLEEMNHLFSGVTHHCLS
jgi:hypothetical protein